MFHDLHGEAHPRTAGSIDADLLDDVLRHAEQTYRLLDAQD
ncbi:MAG: hypothetical protein QNJ92_09460 [Alphaproteobacteria bacterium]|nr:hypothetical protein [Alphaproteobacteria bacterium]